MLDISIHCFCKYYVILNYLLTPWSWILLKKLYGSHLVKKFPSILWKKKVHYRIHKFMPPVPILSLLDLVHAPNIPLPEDPIYFKALFSDITPTLLWKKTSKSLSTQMVPGPRSEPGTSRIRSKSDTRSMYLPLTRSAVRWAVPQGDGWNSHPLTHSLFNPRLVSPRRTSLYQSPAASSISQRRYFFASPHR